MNQKLIRTSTIPTSLKTFLNGSFEALREKYDLVLVSSPGKELDELREKYGVKTIGVPMERRMSPAKDLKSLWRLIRAFRKEKPYMVHSMTPKAGLLCMMAAWIMRVPRRVHTFTGLVWPTATGFSRRILMATDWLTCACATHVIPEGQGVMNDLRQVTKKPMRVLGYGNVRGVDMDYWCRKNADEEKYRQLRREDKFTFLFVGRIVRDKGINELVEAFKQLRERQKNVRLLLVGGFEDKLDPISEDTRAYIGICPAIEYLGLQSGSELLACYAASDCFVFPSYREGFPNTVLEAGAMELPSIVTDINGSKEIVKNEENGLVIPSKNVPKLVEAMERIVENGDLREQMVANARKMVGDRFEQGFVRKCLLDFYDEIG